MNSQISNILLILLISILGAGNGPAVKFGAQQIAPLSFAAARVLLATFFVLPLLIRHRIWQIIYQPKLIGFSLLLTANIILFVLGVINTTISIAAMLYTLVPLFTVIASHFLYQEKLTHLKVLGIIFGLIGAGIIILIPVISRNGVYVGTLSGNLIILSAVLAFSAYTILSKRAQNKFSPLVLTLSFLVTATVVSLPLALGQHGLTSFYPFIYNPKAVLAVIYASLLGTIAFYFLFQFAVKKTSPLIASLMVYLQPVFSVIFGMLFFAERLTATFVIGSFLSLFGVWLVTKKS